MASATESFSIGFRRGGSEWQQQDIALLAQWARSSGFQAIDLGETSANEIAVVAAAGLKLGSVDLLHFGEITHPDPGRRRDVMAANIEYVRALAALGAKIFFTIVGGDPARSRADNYRIAVESFTPIADAAASAGAVIAVEGYPGHAPHYALLCTTPETCRAFLGDIPRGVGINYDPSHLIRLGVDHVRFLKEFAPHLVHVHAKDTMVRPEAVYELGLYQPSAFRPAHRYGEHIWRYTIPGSGDARWGEIFAALRSSGYKGIVSVELEDEQFNGSETREKAGLGLSLVFLRGVAG